MSTLKIKKIHPDAKVPTYAHPGDAGMDLYALAKTVIRPRQRVLIPTGLAFQLPKGTVGLIWDKSGLSTKYGVKVLAGVLDEGYRGELLVALTNLGSTSVTFQAGDKVAQMLIQQVHQPKISVVAELTATVRGAKGFGSSGRA